MTNPRRVEHAMKSTMMNVPLSINDFLERAGTTFPHSTIASRLPEKSLRTQRCAGHDRPAEGRCLLAPLDRAAHADRLPCRRVGLALDRHGAAGDADVPREQLG